MLYKRTSEAKFDCEQQSAERIPPTFKKMEKVAIQSSGLTFLFPRYSLGKCSAFESHSLSGKGGEQSSGLRISDSSLTLKEMFGDESHSLSGKGGEQSSGLAFLIPRYSLGKCLAFESHLHNKKAGTSCPLFIMAEKVGFEPTCGCPQTLFESAPLRPLRYFSIPISFFFLAVP